MCRLFSQEDFLNMYRLKDLKLDCDFSFLFSDIQMELDICSYEESAHFI